MKVVKTVGNTEIKLELNQAEMIAMGRIVSLAYSAFIEDSLEYELANTLTEYDYFSYHSVLTDQTNLKRGRLVTILEKMQ